MPEVHSAASMLEFVTLLIGLVTGARQVELAVHGPVAAVELLVDGRVVRRLESPLWRTEVDFGPRLEPHRLQAIAYDEHRQRLDSIQQTVNYSRASFEAAIVLETTSNGPVRSGRVVWRGALSEPPRRVELTFDSRRLEVDGEGRFDLPIYDPEGLHLLETVLTFADGSPGHAELTLGGEFVEQTTTALTAVPVRSPVASSWGTDRVRGWLASAGEELAVFTTVGGPAPSWC